MLVLIAKAKGTPAALQRYAELKKSAAAEYQFEERHAERLGLYIAVLRPGAGRDYRVSSAMWRNTRNRGNVYDSLGEAYMKPGKGAGRSEL